MRRTSHEVRGLKYSKETDAATLIGSHLTRGAWIEIDNMAGIESLVPVAPHTRCVD